MAACDVAGLMRHHADKHAGPVGLEDEAGMNEHVGAARDIGVNRRVFHDKDVNSIGIQACRIENRVAVGAQRVFDLRVADESHGGRFRPIKGQNDT